MGDLLLCWLAAWLCIMAAIERPDRLKFWLWCCYGCMAVSVFVTVEMIS